MKFITNDKYSLLFNTDCASEYHPDRLELKVFAPKDKSISLILAVDVRKDYTDIGFFDSTYINEVFSISNVDLSQELSLLRYTNNINMFQYIYEHGVEELRLIATSKRLLRWFMYSVGQHRHIFVDTLLN